MMNISLKLVLKIYEDENETYDTDEDYWRKYKLVGKDLFFSNIRDIM